MSKADLQKWAKKHQSRNCRRNVPRTALLLVGRDSSNMLCTLKTSIRYLGRSTLLQGLPLHSRRMGVLEECMSCSAKPLRLWGARMGFGDGVQNNFGSTPIRDKDCRRGRRPIRWVGLAQSRKYRLEAVKIIGCSGRRV